MIRPTSIRIAEELLKKYIPSNPIAGINATLDLGAERLLSRETQRELSGEKESVADIIRMHFVSGYSRTGSGHTKKEIIELLEESLAEKLINSYIKLAERGIIEGKSLEIMLKLPSDGRKYLAFAHEFGKLVSHDVFFQALRATYTLYPTATRMDKSINKDYLLIHSLAQLTESTGNTIAKYGTEEGSLFDLRKPDIVKQMVALDSHGRITIVPEYKG